MSCDIDLNVITQKKSLIVPEPKQLIYHIHRRRAAQPTDIRSPCDDTQTGYKTVLSSSTPTLPPVSAEPLSLDGGSALAPSNKRTYIR